VRFHFKFVAAGIAAIGFSVGIAGSYEDFFRAINLDRPDIVQKLLEEGFEPNAPNPEGFDALYLALRDGSLKSARVLIDWPKTNVDKRTDKDETPLMLACIRGQADVARRLIARGADVNKTGWTPLHYAASSGQIEIIRMLLDQNAYIDAESPNGTTPLMMAAMYGTAEAVKLLLDAGADPSVKNQFGLRAAEFAKQAGREDLAVGLDGAAKAFDLRYRNASPQR